MVAWFRDKDVTLALGISGGAAFSAGAAFALYVWVYVQRATSWHTSLILAGVFELVVMLVTLAFFQVPEGAPLLRVARLDRAAIRASLAAQISGCTASRCSAATAPTSPPRSCSAST